MKEMDWNNPPKRLRVVLRIPTNKILRAYNDSKFPLKEEKIKVEKSLLEVFASGSNEIDFKLKNSEPSVFYEKVKDSSQALEEKGIIRASRHITYELR